MVPHDQEDPVFTYSLSAERQNLRTHKGARAVPDKSDQTLLSATWNLTNLGLQGRTGDDFELMAEIIGWFDLIAIQEIDDDLTHLRELIKRLPRSYSVIISDIGGNRERAGFIFDEQKVRRLELAAEVAIPPSDHRNIRLRGVSGAYRGFDRNPYVVAFQAGSVEFTAVSVHLFFGSHAYYDEDRRALEAYALARWADQRRKSSGAYSQNVLVLGDFNLPVRDETSSVYRALKVKGMHLPDHQTSIGSNLAGDKQYDQIMFHGGKMGVHYTGYSGVFDFDHAPFFNGAWQRGRDYFDAAVKYHISDHRPIWAQFNI